MVGRERINSGSSVTMQLLGSKFSDNGDKLEKLEAPPSVETLVGVLNSEEKKDIFSVYVFQSAPKVSNSHTLNSRSSFPKFSERELTFTYASAERL
jgi:hypothetical protein